MLREMQREVNMGFPFEGRLHIDYSTNNQVLAQVATCPQVVNGVELVLSQFLL